MTDGQITLLIWLGAIVLLFVGMEWADAFGKRKKAKNSRNNCCCNCSCNNSGKTDEQKHL